MYLPNNEHFKNKILRKLSLAIKEIDLKLHIRRKGMKSEDIKKAYELLKSAKTSDDSDLFAYCDKCKDGHFSFEARKDCFNNLEEKV